MIKAEVYVGYSIKGTKSFVSANRIASFDQKLGMNDSFVLDGFEFRVGASRTASLNGGLKLMSSGLNDDKTWGGFPTKDPSQVTAFFKALLDKGWRMHTQHPNYPDLVNAETSPPLDQTVVVVTKAQGGNQEVVNTRGAARSITFVPALLEWLGSTGKTITRAEWDNSLRQQMRATYGYQWQLTFATFCAKVMGTKSVTDTFDVTATNDTLTIAKKAPT